MDLPANWAVRDRILQRSDGVGIYTSEDPLGDLDAPLAFVAAGDDDAVQLRDEDHPLAARTLRAAMEEIDARWPFGRARSLRWVRHWSDEVGVYLVLLRGGSEERGAIPGGNQGYVEAVVSRSDRGRPDLWAVNLRGVWDAVQPGTLPSVVEALRGIIPDLPAGDAPDPGDPG